MPFFDLPLLPDGALLQSGIHWLAHGWSNASWWQMLVYTLVMTHITIVSVTLFLHRSQAHRSLDLHPVPAHFFRFWLWLTTGMVTKEWVAIHRKHHAKCETADDPHSPQTRGLDTVMWRGAELYRTESTNAETLQKFGHGTPNDWIERNLYSRFAWQGVGLMLVLDLLMFGGWGATIWAVQMLWIPFWAAGVVNGVGHYWGYRNFEAPDASTNLIPWGIVIGGEELHNNHHTYPTAAKFSVKPFEFDVGWMYINILKAVGWVTVKKVPPKLDWDHAQCESTRPSTPADEKTLEVLIANRYEVMARYARNIRLACQHEMTALKARQADISMLKTAKRWLHRDVDKVPTGAKTQLSQVLVNHPMLHTMVSMREELRQLWLDTNLSREQLIANLQAWCHRAEDSGITALRDFSLRLRSART